MSAAESIAEAAHRVVDLDAPTPEPTVTVPAARYAEMLRTVDELTESRDHAVSTGLDALDRVRELEELLRAGTPRARAIAVLRAEGIEPVPADEVRAMREAVRERDRLRAALDEAEAIEEIAKRGESELDEDLRTAREEIARMREGLDTLEALARRIVREVRDPKTSAAIVEDLDATMREVRGA